MKCNVNGCCKFKSLLGILAWIVALVLMIAYWSVKDAVFLGMDQTGLYQSVVMLTLFGLLTVKMCDVCKGMKK